MLRITLQADDPVFSTRFLEYQDMRHAPGFASHYHDLGISSLRGHDSACNRILSVGEVYGLS